MHRIACPHCGLRDEAEFRYRGDATIARPPPDADVGVFFDYVYSRANPAGWHVEWWHHVHGCRQVLKVVRNTLTHDVAAVGLPSDALAPPPEGSAR